MHQHNNSVDNRTQILSNNRNVIKAICNSDMVGTEAKAETGMLFSSEAAMEGMNNSMTTYHKETGLA